MFSIGVGLAVGIVALCAALYKGRTGWHWLALTLLAFALAWIVSAGGLYLAGVSLPFTRIDKVLAAFVGVLTGVVILAILIFVPHRPRRHSPSPQTRARPGQTETN